MPPSTRKKRTSGFSHLFDLELLGPELLELQALDLDLALTGFDADELKLYMSLETEGLTDPDD